MCERRRAHTLVWPICVDATHVRLLRSPIEWCARLASTCEQADLRWLWQQHPHGPVRPKCRTGPLGPACRAEHPRSSAGWLCAEERAQPLLLALGAACGQGRPRWHVRLHAPSPCMRLIQARLVLRDRAPWRVAAQYWPTGGRLSPEVQLYGRRGPWRAVEQSSKSAPCPVFIAVANFNVYDYT